MVLAIGGFIDASVFSEGMVSHVARFCRHLPTGHGSLSAGVGRMRRCFNCPRRFF